MDSESQASTVSQPSAVVRDQPPSQVTPVVTQSHPNQTSTVSVFSGVSKEQLFKGMQEGEDLLTWFKRNAENIQRGAVNPDEMIKETEAKLAAPAAAPEATPAPESTPPATEVPEIDIFEEEQKVSIEEPPQPEETVEEAKPTKEENFKIVRKKLAETATVIKQKEQELEEVKSRLSKYETGEELAEPVKNQLAQLEELEKYRQIHAFKTSKLYKEAIQKPLVVLKDKLKSMAEDYGVDPDALEGLTELPNAEINRRLSGTFDELGALEAKSVINEIKKIYQQEKTLHDEPVKVIQEIEENNKKLMEHQRQRAAEALANISRGAWAEALLEVRKDGKAQELIIKDDDPEHNAKISEPILKSAATQYGKLVRMLAENGLENLPKDLAKALAKMVQLSTASAVSIEARTRALQHAKELEENTKRTTNYVRPPLGGSMTGGNSSGPQQRMTPESAADQLLGKIRRS